MHKYTAIVFRFDLKTNLEKTKLSYRPQLSATYIISTLLTCNKKKKQVLDISLSYIHNSSTTGGETMARHHNIFFGFINEKDGKHTFLSLYTRQSILSKYMGTEYLYLFELYHGRYSLNNMRVYLIGFTNHI